MPVGIERAAVVLGQSTPHTGGLVAGHAQLEFEAFVLHWAARAQPRSQLAVCGVVAGELRRLALGVCLDAQTVSQDDDGSPLRPRIVS